MSVTLPQQSPVPREFVGLARELRRQLEIDDVIAYNELGKIHTPLGAMTHHHQEIRPAMLQRAAAAWTEKVPKTGRLRLEIEVKPRSLRIRELRVLASDSRFSAWDERETESGIALVAMGLELSPGRFRYDPVFLAGISLHAVARWHQRTFANSRQNLFGDLRRLAMASEGLQRSAGHGFKIDSGDGAWVGEVSQITDNGSCYSILSVRSFLGA